MENVSFTDRFVDRLFSLTTKTFSEKTFTQAKKCLLDYLGATFAGSMIIAEKRNRLLKDLGSSTGEATVIGYDRKTDLQTAVFCNGLSSHAAELDDGHRFGMMHPGAPIISALFSVVEVNKLSQIGLLRGIIIGYEAALGMAKLMQPNLKQKGLHATAICGSIGAAVAIATSLKFSKAQIKDAISAAAISAGGLLKAIEDGSELKPYNVGQAAHKGLIAAYMASSGFMGPEDVLSGNSGFFSIMTGNIELPKITIEDEPMLIEQVYFKPYAACRHCHAPIDAALKIRTLHHLHLEDIKQIEVTTYQGAIKRHDHIEITNISSAKMSIPYTVAIALYTGKAGITEFTKEHIQNPALIQLVNKVKVQTDQELSDLVPKLRPATLRITTKDDQTYQARCDLPKGEPENPLSIEELEQKFISLAIYGQRSLSQAEAIVRAVWGDDQDLSCLFKSV